MPLTLDTAEALCRELSGLAAEARIAAKVLSEKGMPAFAVRLDSQARRAAKLVAGIHQQMKEP